jgi:hypothetical protein
VKFTRLELVLAVVALALFVALPVLAADDNTHEGKVVSAAAGKLITIDKDGKNETTCTVAPDAKITIDGKAAKLDDLKKGTFVRVTMDKNDKTLAVAVAASTKEKE